jgi:hypothetical protein
MIGFDCLLLYSDVKVPKDVYKNFRSVFSIWVEIQAILDQHVAKMIEAVPLPETMGPANDSDVLPLPDVPPPPDVSPPDVPPPAETFKRAPK